MYCQFYLRCVQTNSEIKIMYQALLHYVLAALTLVATAYSQFVPPSLVKNDTSVLGKVQEGIQHDISSVQTPVVKAVAAAVFHHCDNVKKLLGVSYDQLDGEKEPDVNSLSLKYISRDVNVSYNINAAARLISTDERSYGPDEKLYIYIHGFTDDPGKSSFGNVSEALFFKGIENVLALDAGFLIAKWYLRSTSYVRFVGEKMGEVLAALVHSGISPSMIHIIGHSLGSQMAGFTGKRFYQLTGLRVGRITGLDPAGPCFAQVEPDLRIQASDADFVDIIHTNGGIAGIEEPVGQVDYYPNGGSDQPKCSDPSCSHSRSWLYFAESVVNPHAFPAVKCDDWEQFKKGQCRNETSYMGFPAKPGTRGKFYLQTSGDQPFGLGVRGLQYENKSFIKSLFT